MMNPLRKLTFLLIASLALFFAGTEIAFSQSGLVVTAEAGLDGYCKEDMWFPVRITVENNGPNLDSTLYVTTSEGQSDWSFATEVSIPSISRKEIQIYAYPQGRETEVDITLSAGGEVVYEETLPISCQQRNDWLLGVWAQNPSVFNPQTGIRAGGGRAALLVLDAEDIPDRPQGLEMLDTLTISNVDTGSLSAAQHDALASWVANGGILLVTGGPNWLKTAAGLNDLLPLQPNGTSTLDSLSGISQAFLAEGVPSGEAVVAAGEIGSGAVVRASEGDIPLVLERSYGFGRILYLTPDPALEPLRTWTGAGDLYRELLGVPTDVPSWNKGFTQWYDANEAMNTIAGLELPPIWLVCGGIVLYIFLVGPVNYFVLQRRKKRETAWVSIPVIALFSTAVILVFSATLLGNRPVVNRLALVEVWPDADQAYVHGLIGVFSPTRETFRLEMDGGFIAHPIPRQGLGQDIRDRVILQTATGFSIPALRVDIGDLEGVAVTGLIPAPALSTDLTLQMPGGGAQVLEGTIRNDSSLTLRDAVLITNASSRHLGDLSPGQQAEINAVQTGGSATPLSSAITGGPAIITDSTLVDLFGTSYFSPNGSSDMEAYRRFTLMRAALGSDYGTRGGESFLIAWTESAPYETSLSGRPERLTDTTAYVFHLDPTLVSDPAESDRLVLTPAFFAWSPYGTSSSGVAISPYNSYLDSGDFALQFTPKEGISFSDVEELTLHLESFSQTGSVPFEVELWDFSEEAWSRVPNARWGDLQIQSPARFVSRTGTIRLRLSNAQPYSQQIERADFTLVVIP